jgi:hypothetical protein
MPAACMLSKHAQAGATSASHRPPPRSIPTKAWYDGPKGMSRVEMFSGVDTVLTVDSVEYDIHPRIQQEKCYKADQHATAKPVSFQFLCRLPNSSWGQLT